MLELLQVKNIGFDTQQDPSEDPFGAHVLREYVGFPPACANRSEFEPQSETHTGIIGPVTTDPHEAIGVNGPARAEVVTDLDLGADGPPLVLPVVGYFGVQLGPVSFAKWLDRTSTRTTRPPSTRSAQTLQVDFISAILASIALL